jgi:predicted ATPase/class 3 adenylate cyclase
MRNGNGPNRGIAPQSWSRAGPVLATTPSRIAVGRAAFRPRSRASGPITESPTRTLSGPMAGRNRHALYSTRRAPSTRARACCKIADPMTMPSATGVVTFLFTDIEGSTRLWETDAERMKPALARHDALARDAVRRNRGTLVKTTGDGVHAAFDDPLDAVTAALQLQLALAEPHATDDLALQVRCGMHLGVSERRDNDYYGRAINRAARIMSVAQGGQVLLSQAVAVLVADRLGAEVSLRDLGEARLRDLAGAERIFQLVHPRLRAEFPPLRALEDTPNNLPQQLTLFVGRERELAEVSERIPRCRLLTLTGPGGIGKTRLSLQAAADVMDHFADGVHFVEFAPVSDARMVPQTVATVLGVKEEAGRPVIEAIVRYVRDRKLLLILDNCEHLVRACAELANALLRVATGLHIIASSREALRIDGETCYPVSSLSVPDAGDRNMSAGAMAKFEAVRLFVERAMAAQPSFRMTDNNGAAIAEICRRLDGIPLAIELAAARTRTMSVTQIAERLSDRFRLLAAGDRSALPRQQTLRALIDWSYDLLSEAERMLLCRLAVFAGGFTLEAAEAIASSDRIAENDVMDLLAQLIDKSLVAADVDRGRYGLLETVRQYAQDRLQESGEESRTRARHLAYFRKFAEELRPELFGPEPERPLSRLDVERLNLLSAHRYCDRAEDGAIAGMQLVDALKLYWFNRGLLRLGCNVTVEALSRPCIGPQDLLRCRVLLAVGQFMSWLGRYREGQRHLEEGLAIARGLDDQEMIARMLQPLALAKLGQDDRAGARTCLEEALARARSQGDKRELAAALNQAAQVDRIDSRSALATARYEEALALARDLDDPAIVAVTLLNLAMVAVSESAPERVAGMLRETLAIAERTGDRLAGQSTLDVCTGLAALCGDQAQAARFHGMAEAQLRELGMQRDPVDRAFVSPWVAQAARELAPGQFADCRAAGNVIAYGDAIAEARQWLLRWPS